jgi:hypothetical protein
MATYPIKLMYDESGHAFVPLTSMDAVIGEKNVQYILDAVELSPGHFQIKITDMQLDKLLNTAVIVRWPQISSTVKPSYLQLNDEEEKLLYNGNGTEYLSLEEASNTINILAFSGDKWVLASGAGTGGGGHIIANAEGNTLDQQKVLQFVGFNIENDAANRATKISNPQPINNLTTTEIGVGSLDAYQGHVLASRTIPSGGKPGQVLAKSNNVDYQVEWVDKDSDDVITSNGSVDQIISLTYAEYKALEANGEINPTTQYIINDMSEKEKTFMTDGEVQTLIDNSIDESKNNMGTITVDEIINKNLFNVFGVHEMFGNHNYSIQLDGSLFCPSLDGNGGYILYSEKYKNDGTYVLSYYRQSNTTTRPMFRCYNAAGEIIQVTDVGLEGFIYNSIYDGYWCDFTDSRVSLTLNFNPDVAYFQIGFVGLEYTIKDVMLSRGVTDFDFVPQTCYGVWSGSNENGHWIRYADGTLICRHIHNVGSCTFTLHSGGLYTEKEHEGYYQWKLPQQFINRDVAITATCISSAYMCTSAGGLTSDGKACNIFYNTCYPCTTNVNLCMIAIGRWK